jgi:hypothetical protein
MNAGTVIIARQNRYMRTFAEAGAVSAQSAKTLEQLECRNSFIFRRLAAREVFRSTGDGRYYLDMDAADRFRALRRGRALTIFFIAALAALVAWLLLRR